MAKIRGWNGGWLEIGLSVVEAVALRDIMGFLADHPAYWQRAENGDAQTPDLPVAKPEEEDRLIMEMANSLHRVVHARTGVKR